MQSSHLRCSLTKGVFKNLAIFTGKHLCCVRISFYKVAGLKACIFIKKRIQHRCFLVNIAKFLRIPILKKVCKRLLLMIDVSKHQNSNQNIDRLCKMSVKTVQLSSRFSFSFEKHDIQLTLRFIISIQLCNDFVISTLLPPHDLSRDFLRREEHISEKGYLFSRPSALGPSAPLNF